MEEGERIIHPLSFFFPHLLPLTHSCPLVLAAPPQRRGQPDHPVRQRHVGRVDQLQHVPPAEGDGDAGHSLKAAEPHGQDDAGE